MRNLSGFGVTAWLSMKRVGILWKLRNLSGFGVTARLSMQSVDILWKLRNLSGFGVTARFFSSWIRSLQLDGVVLRASVQLWVPTDFGVPLSVVSIRNSLVSCLVSSVSRFRSPRHGDYPPPFEAALETVLGGVNGEITHQASGYSLKVEKFEWIWCNGVITHEANGYSLKVEEFEWIWCNGVITHLLHG